MKFARTFSNVSCNLLSHTAFSFKQNSRHLGQSALILKPLGGAMRVSRWFAPVVLLLLAATAWAQVTTGSIAGTVRDTSGAVIPNAKVTLRDVDKNVDVRTATSGTSGEFSFPELPIGHYSVTVEAPGFQRNVQT
jgi:hypothetical protein